jgi:molybdopterin molybdotransferase
MIIIQHADFDAAALTIDLRTRAGAPTGALVSFTGYVRDFAPDSPTHSLLIEHYPGMCERVIAELLEQARARWSILGATVVHRVGELQAGEQIVFVGVISAHRSDAFDACRFLIDQLKTQAPFWKRETLVCGRQFWVDAPMQDDIPTNSKQASASSTLYGAPLMLDFSAAQCRLAHAAPAATRSEIVPLHAARGRVLAHAVLATEDLPPADNSAMDGYALRLADLHTSVNLPVTQTIYAGEPARPLIPGSAARLFTGSLIPPGADAVVAQEQARRDGDTIKLSGPVTVGQYIRCRASDTHKGELVLPTGLQLQAAHIGMLAAQGLATVTVRPIVRLGILSTGDELIAPGEPRADHQVYDANAPMLAALVDMLGAQVTLAVRAPDGRAALVDAFERLVQTCDLIISIGGVSVGEKDLIKPVLHDLGASLDLWRVRMKPGKPVALAHLGDVPVVGLPGNPVSAFVVFTLLVTPLIRRMQGRTDLFPRVQQVPLRLRTPHHDLREEFLRVRLCQASSDSMAELTPVDRQDSSIISSLLWADGLARIPADTPVHNGGRVAYYDFGCWLS